MDFYIQAEIDFHDRGVLYPGEVEILLDQFIDECIASNKHEILVITGKGKVVKPVVKSYLGKNKHVESFKQAGYYNGGEGAFEVVLK